jgi:hypothetical protein
MKYRSEVRCKSYNNPADRRCHTMRAKKLPERPGPRGAKDSIRFRERLDDSAGSITRNEREFESARWEEIALRAKWCTPLGAQIFDARGTRRRFCIEAFGRFRAAETAPLVRRIHPARAGD